METKLELYQRNKAIPFSLLQGSTAAFPAGTASRRACSHVPGHATLMQLSPQSHESCMWGQPPLGLPASSGSTGPLWVCQPPLGLPAPSHFPGKNGERAGCCLTRRKASQNSCSERMQEFKRQLPPQQTLCRAPHCCGGNRDFMGAMFLFLLSSSRKKNQLPNQSSEKEET